MRTIFFGSSRGCGLETLLLLLKNSTENDSAHVLIRNKQAFTATLKERGFERFIDTPKLDIFVGDAFKSIDVHTFIKGVSAKGHIDYVVSSLGYTPSSIPLHKLFAPVQFPKGLEHICSDTMTNILDALKSVASAQNDGKVPSLIVVSSNGIGHSTHNALPFLLRGLYGWYLRYPHEDKHLMEDMLHEKYAVPSPDFKQKGSPQPEANVFDKDKLVIVRPSLLTDGEKKGKVRIASDLLSSAWFVSRKDVGAYIAGNCLRVGHPTKADDKTRDSSSNVWKGARVISY